MRKLLFFSLVPLFWLACNENSPQPAVDLTGDSDVELTSDISLFNSMKSDRSSYPFDIRDIFREGEMVKVVVQYAGGCESHDFQVLWNQVLDKKTNGEYGFNMTELLITHNANGEMCEAALTDTLSIALNDLDNEIDWDFYAVRVINGSKKQSLVTLPGMETVRESENCILEVEMERVICGDGLLGNVWFRYAEQDYLQPAAIASFTLIDPDLPEGKYKIGVKVTNWAPDPDVAICTAFPGWSVPVEIWCLEKIN